MTAPHDPYAWLTALAELEAAATAGPWSTASMPSENAARFLVIDGCCTPCIGKESDARLIAAARNNLPRLLRLARACVRLEAAHAAWWGANERDDYAATTAELTAAVAERSAAVLALKDEVKP